MSTTRRFLALLLVLCLVFGALPVQILAAEDGSNQVSAVEMPGVSRLDNQAEPETESYDDDELVTVIVKLEDPAVLDYYGAAARTGSAGEAVSEFLASEEAKELSEELLQSQQETLDQLADETEDFEVLAQWTGLFNGMAVELPYGQLETLRSTPGVVSAQIQKVYSAPEEPEIDAGSAGYSYDMTGLNSVWNSGFTGEGMVVAVLDTGLDIEWASWYEPTVDDNVTGVRRTHEAFRNDSFKTEAGLYNRRWTESGMKRFLETNQLMVNTGIDGNLVVYDENALYKNMKVPFAVDYADGDANIRTEYSSHGTHVAGTIAGYAETEEGEVIFSGVAPDAQILAMKVFDDVATGAMELCIINALEDAARLGADVVNLSLGSDNGFADDDTAVAEVYARLAETGVVFVISAGNSYYSSMLSNYGDYGLAENPEISMIASPAVYPGNLSVASVNNTVSSAPYLSWTDAAGQSYDVAYDDPNTTGAFRSKFAVDGALPVNIIPVDGYGTYYDYYNAGFRGYYGYGDKGVTGIALVKRGGDLSFVEKINNATQFSWSYYDPAKGYYVTEYPIKAVIIYDEDPESTELVTMSVEDATVTSIFISGKDGAALAEAAKAAAAEGSNVTLSNVEAQNRITSWELGGEVSEFSSWGAAPALELKPEITAPGGNIWSTVMDETYYAGVGTYSDYTGAYAMMSGTSMAAPHMSGISALVKQYAMEELKLTSAQAANLTKQLLVSTAVPMKDGNDVFYSPRVQGAGMVDADAAITTPAYISVNGGVGKLELKDDAEKTGIYTLSFTVHNMSANDLTYSVNATVLRPDTETVETQWGERLVMAARDVLLHEEDLGTITVPAYSEVEFTATVSLTDEEKALLDELFANGTYVEGFVSLTCEGQPALGLPMLAFYGDWTKAPIYDSALWIDEVSEGSNYMDLESTWGTTIIGYYDGYSFQNLGQNVFDSNSSVNQNRYYQENITISPTGIMKEINDYSLHQLREAKLVVVEVTDKETGEVYFHDFTTYQIKDYYYTSVQGPVPSSQQYFIEENWGGTDLEGNVLPSGTQCVMTITAYGEGEYPTIMNEDVGYVVTDFEAVASGEALPSFNGHAMDMTGDVIAFDVLVDTKAPELTNSAVSIYEEDGKVWLEGTFNDDGSLASVEIFPQVKRSYNTQNNPYADPAYFEYGMDKNNPFYTEMIYDADVQQWNFRCDITEYAHTNESYGGENYYYNFEWTGNIFIFGGDYGGNDRGYAITVNTDPGLVLSHTSARLHVGDTFELSVIDNTGANAPITRTSENPKVASTDEYGIITAVAPGQTVITVSNGEETVVCVVAVEEHPTEVIDFDLSIDQFTGLKPDGSIVVKVTNLQPADVVITENTWMVYENDEEWAGLLNVAQNTSDAMSGTISLNASLYESEESTAGSGYLQVTLNGVTRTMNFDWEDLYQSTTQDGLISDAYYGEQTVYVTQGETANLIAKYRQNHSFIPVELYTMEGYTQYGYSNPTTAANGVVLDGPNYTANGVSWSGKLVALPGYQLPATIKVCTRYDYGYESEMYLDAYYNGYTYDPTTGEIFVKESPYGASNTMVIRADGVATEGAPGGTHSGVEYTRPDGTYGPFVWTVTEGNGELTTGTVSANYENKNAAFYTPTEPGISYITATSSDGAYSIRFAVVCEGVKAEKLELDNKALTLEAGDTTSLIATLTPEPTLAEDKALIFTSFNEEVATVDENGVITAVAPGYAYIKVALANNTNVVSNCIVEVTAPPIVTLSGSIVSSGDEAVTVQLWQGENLVLSQDVTGESYQFDIIPGDYTLTVSKLNHVTRSYEISVGDEGAVQDVTICLTGDVTGDGAVNIGDIARLYAHVCGTNLLTDDYAMACADVNGDAQADIGDVAGLYANIRETHTEH